MADWHKIMDIPSEQAEQTSHKDNYISHQAQTTKRNLKLVKDFSFRSALKDKSKSLFTYHEILFFQFCESSVPW